PRLRAAGRLSDHLEVRLQVQDTGNTAADDLMVIDEEDPGHQPPPITPALESWHRCGMDTGVYRATHRLARDLLATLVGPRTQLRALRGAEDRQQPDVNVKDRGTPCARSSSTSPCSATPPRSP